MLVWSAFDRLSYFPSLEGELLSFQTFNWLRLNTSCYSITHPASFPHTLSALGGRKYLSSSQISTQFMFCKTLSGLRNSVLLFVAKLPQSKMQSVL